MFTFGRSASASRIRRNQPTHARTTQDDSMTATSIDRLETKLQAINDWLRVSSANQHMPIPSAPPLTPLQSSAATGAHTVFFNSNNNNDDDTCTASTQTFNANLTTNTLEPTNNRASCLRRVEDKEDNVATATGATITKTLKKRTHTNESDDDATMDEEPSRKKTNEQKNSPHPLLYERRTRSKVRLNNRRYLSPSPARFNGDDDISLDGMNTRSRRERLLRRLNYRRSLHRRRDMYDELHSPSTNAPTTTDDAAAAVIPFSADRPIPMMYQPMHAQTPSSPVINNHTHVVCDRNSEEKDQSDVDDEDDEDENDEVTERKNQRRHHRHRHQNRKRNGVDKRMSKTSGRGIIRHLLSSFGRSLSLSSNVVAVCYLLHRTGYLPEPISSLMSYADGARTWLGDTHAVSLARNFIGHMVSSRIGGWFNNGVASSSNTVSNLARTATETLFGATNNTDDDLSIGNIIRSTSSLTVSPSVLLNRALKPRA